MSISLETTSPHQNTVSGRALANSPNAAVIMTFSLCWTFIIGGCWERIDSYEHNKRRACAIKNLVVKFETNTGCYSNNLLVRQRTVGYLVACHTYFIYNWNYFETVPVAESLTDYLSVRPCMSVLKG